MLLKNPFQTIAHTVAAPSNAPYIHMHAAAEEWDLLFPTQNIHDNNQNFRMFHNILKDKSDVGFGNGIKIFNRINMLIV